MSQVSFKHFLKYIQEKSLQDTVEWEWHILLFRNFGKRSAAVREVRGERVSQRTHEKG